MAQLPNPQAPMPLSLEGARMGVLERARATPGRGAGPSNRPGVDAVVQIRAELPQDAAADAWRRLAGRPTPAPLPTPRPTPGVATPRPEPPRVASPPAERPAPPPPDPARSSPLPALSPLVRGGAGSVGPAATRETDLMRLTHVLLGQLVAGRRRVDERGRARALSPGEVKELRQLADKAQRALITALRGHAVHTEEEERAAALLARLARRLDAEGLDRLPAELTLRDMRRHLATLLRARGLAPPTTLHLEGLSDRLGLPLDLRPAWMEAILARRRPLAVVGAVMAFLAFGLLTLSVAR